jgi:hypothetical protein
MKPVLGVFIIIIFPYDKFNSVQLNNQSREKREEWKRKSAVNSGHLVPWQHTQAARTNYISVEPGK